MPHLARITIHPVKSLDGVSVEAARVLPCGALADDRRWRLVDPEGGVIDAKRTPRLHAIRAAFDLGPGPDTPSVTLRVDVRGEAGGARAPRTFPLHPGPGGPCGWLSEVLGIEVRLEERLEGGFPDDRDRPGATVIATASLLEVGRWFSRSLDDVRRRFRANLEIGDCEPFWEDALAHPARPARAAAAAPLDSSPLVDPWADAPPEPPRSFLVGGVALTAAEACRRCAVPSRDPDDGRVIEHFREVFEAWRRRGMRRDVDVSCWQGPYRLAIHTVGDGRGGNVQVGDRIVPVAHPGVS